MGLLLFMGINKHDLTARFKGPNDRGEWGRGIIIHLTGLITIVIGNGIFNFVWGERNKFSNPLTHPHALPNDFEEMILTDGAF